MNTIIHIILPLILEAIVVAIVFATLKGVSLPLIHNAHASLIALLVVGLTMCVLGGVGQVGPIGRWTSLIAITGILLGIVILFMIISALASWKLPISISETQMVTAVGVILTIKLILGTFGFFLNWF